MGKISGDTRWRYIVFALASLLFCVIIFFSLSNLFDQKRLVERDSTINIWFLAQTEIEFLRLMETLHLYDLSHRSDIPAKPLEHDELMERFDIFWSRLPVLLQGPQSSMLRQIDGFEATVKDIVGVLEAVEPQITTLTPENGAAHVEIMDKLESIRKPLHGLVVNSLLYDSGIYKQRKSDLAVLFNRLIVYFSVIVAAGVLLFVLFYREIGRTQRLFEQAHEAEARESQARSQLETAIESVSEGFIVYDADDKIVVHNNRYVELHPNQADVLAPGATFEDLLRHAVATGGITIPEDEVEDWIADCVASHLNPADPFESRLNNGTWLKISERRTKDGSIVGVHTDITELKNREAELEEKSALLQATLENISHGICVFDSKMRLLNWNEIFLDLFRLSPESVKSGWPMEAFVRHNAEQGEYGLGPADALVAQSIGEARRMFLPGASSGRFERTRGDGRVLEVRWSPMPGGGVVKSYLDITDRTEAEAERTRLLDQFHASQRLEAMGTMAGGIAHDFNNILGSILGNADILLEEKSADDPDHPRLSQILNSGMRAKDLVSQILSYSRQQDLETSPLRLSDMMSEVLGLMRSTLPSTIRIEAQDICQGVILADATQIHQVLVNLFVNASQAIGPTTGKIEARVEEARISAEDQKDILGDSSLAMQDSSWSRLEDRAGRSRLYLGLPERGTYFKVTVRDNGCGMGRAQIARIFEPFYTTKEVGEGSGLGLAAVHGIVANHGGCLVVDSQEGAGTTFQVLFPKLEKAVEKIIAKAPPPAALTNGNAVAAKGKRVMLVDDDAALLEIGRLTLVRDGYDVAALTDGNLALAAFRKNPETWDLIITDKTMPGMSGEFLATEMLTIRDGLTIIMWTGFIDDATEESAKALGIREILVKPIVGKALSAVVNKVLAQA